WLKWILWVVILGLGASMAFLFVQTPTGMVGNLGSRNVATVAGNPITVTEFRRRYNLVYDSYRQRFQSDQLDPSIIKQLGLDTQTLNELVSEYVMAYAAQVFGIQVTTEEIVKYITSSPSFQENGQFIGRERYQQLLQSNNYSSAEYEDILRRDILKDKLSKVLTDGIHATAQEVRQEFLNQNQEIKIRYVAIDPDEEAPETVDAEELRSYFEEHKESYGTAEQRKVRYALVPFDRGKVELTEQQITARMASIPEKEAVRARHILISSETPDAVEKGEKILKQLREGGDFAELAKEHSEDEGSAVAGGDLGFFGRGQMVPEFENMAFSLEPGEISDLVATDFGFHIIKVTDVKTVDTRSIAESQLREEEAENLARSLAAKIIHEVENNSDLDAAAQKYEVETRETPFFGLGDTIFGLAVRSDFNQQVFTLAQGQTMEPYLVGESYVVAQLTDVQPSEVSAFEAVQDEVLEDFKSDRGDETARQKAFAFSQEASEKSGFEGVARSHNLKIVTSQFFKRDTSVDDDLGYATEILSRVFLMKENQVSPAVMASGKYVVFQIAEKSAVDEEQFEQEKAGLLEVLSLQKRERFFSDWVQTMIDKLTAEEQIQINSALVDSIVG
ncbi:SurA N-terminal domain-containing protein, partial [Acidobacteria bacterium AH-259-D05]|nr:SurA N-terminal domain-containing protein [Acidobacteria bacterium AH-259-D05]